jgi:RNA polymerase sigma-70 factor (sigma-E family)
MRKTSARIVARHATLRAAFEEHYPGLVRFGTLLTGNRQIGEDLAQDAFVRSAERLATVHSAAAKVYLRRTAVNLWKNRLRRAALERRVHPDTQEDPGLSHEDRDALWHAVRRLPTRQRACLVLRYYEDLPEREVAHVLGCSVGTVKSQTNRALTRLRKEMRDVD